MNHEDTGPIDDRDVSDAYRSLATERAPEHLDRTILAEAEKAARRPSSPMIPWRRPLAWAATIALSFALVLEFTQTSPDLAPPVASPEALEAPAGTESATMFNDRELSLEEDADLPAAARERAPAEKSEADKQLRRQALEVLSAPAPAAADSPAEDGVSIASDVANGQALPEAVRQSGSQSLVPNGRVIAADPSVAPAPESSSAEAGIAITNDVAESEAQEERSRQSSSPVVQDSLSGPDLYLDLDGIEPVCEADVRKSAETWRLCIETLFETDRTAAYTERLLYRAAFPDEPMPTLQP